MNDGPLIIRGIDEVVAALPHLLHVHPQNSLVIFPTDPGRSPLARIDMPTTDAERDEVADELAPVYRVRTTPVVLLAYTDRRDLAEAACTRIAKALQPSTEVSAAVAVTGDRWVRLDRAERGTASQSSKDLYAAEGLLAATLDEDEGVMLGEQEPVLVEGLRSGLVVTLSRW